MLDATIRKQTQQT